MQAITEKIEALREARNEAENERDEAAALYMLTTEFDTTIAKYSQEIDELETVLEEREEDTANAELPGWMYEG